MNLYMCWGFGAEYVTFVFAENARQAKRMTLDWENNALGHYDVTYEDNAHHLVGKTDEVEKPCVVDHKTHPMYPIVEKLGSYFVDKYDEW